MNMYTFKCRKTDRLHRQTGKSRLDAQCQLPIGSWYCIFVETPDTIELYDHAIHH